MKVVTYLGPSDRLRVRDRILIRDVPSELPNDLAAQAAKGRDGRVTVEDIEAADGGEGDENDGS